MNQYSDAIAVLEAAADVCEHNTLINDHEGNREQAEQERRNAAAYRTAIALLEV